MVWLALLPMLVTQDTVITSGMTIDRSMKIKPGTYSMSQSDDEGKSGVITITGHDIDVDFQGAQLLGSDWKTEPDKRKGTAIVVNGTNITIRNVKAAGYKLGLIARNSSGLRLVGCDFSYNWKQHLQSTQDKESDADWMSYHKNESDEWLRYGAGIYLRGCNGFEVKDCRVVGGQCGLMLTGCNNGKIWNNSFSFLSGIGLGMYRSSDNKVMHNNIDWCVRGYSHTKWNRGQDSAGILIYEQSNKNVFAYNSVTHGGDGFFLWAGQTTMDTGKGGCNDNFLYGNDFSHAPTNGIEATFSRNKFVNNLILECWHGIWGGFSYDSEAFGNVFGYNAQAIAWEHGQHNRLTNNLFYRDREGVALWMNSSLDPNWQYPKTKDTSSKDWTIRANEFNTTQTNAFSLRDTKNVEILRNYIVAPSKFISAQGDLAGLKASGNWLWLLNKDALGPYTDNTVSYGASNKSQTAFLAADGNNTETPWVDTETYLDRFAISTWAPYPKDPKPSRGMENDTFVSEYYRATRAVAPAPLEGGKRPFIKPGQLRGRRYILVDEWGPYDFRSPKLWLRGNSNGKLKFEVLGPEGTWKVVSKQGFVSVSQDHGETPDTFEATLDSGQANDVSLELEFTGSEIVTPFGEHIAKGTPYRFGYQKFYAPIPWHVSFFNWDKNAITDPQAHMPAFKDLNLGAAIKTMDVNDLDFGSGGAFYEGGPSDYFATLAEGSITIPEGEYVIDATSDDGVRLFVDDKVVIDNAWKWQVPTTYSVPLHLGGSHKIRVEHYEINGYSALKVSLRKAASK